MNKNKKYHGHKRFYEIQKEHAELHSSKNKDYASGENPLGNFQRVGMMLKLWGIDFKTGNEAEKTAFIYMLKQIDAVGKLLGESRKGDVEDRSKRYDDISVYAIIARILYEENK